MTYATIDLTVGDHVKNDKSITDMAIEQGVLYIKYKLAAAGLEPDDYIITVGGD